MPPAYFEHVPESTRNDHLTIAREILSGARVADVAVVDHGGASVTVTVIVADRTGLFAILCGILGGLGLNIVGGRIFTGPSGIAIDTITGVIEEGSDVPAWATRLASAVERILRDGDGGRRTASTVRSDVVELVVARLARSPAPEGEPLLPIDLSIAEKDDGTRVAIRSQDTPFFLFSLATALALQNVSIVEVEIATHDTTIEDTFLVVGPDGRPVASRDGLAQLRLAVLTTKQFTHALDQAADPRAAFARFEDLVRDVARTGEAERFAALLSAPESQRDLARLLGASDFLWEDFIRLQYESLLPLLDDEGRRAPMSTPPAALASRLDAELEAARDPDDARRRLNAFKDREAFLIDADHILQRDRDFFFLSHRLTALAETIIDRAFRLAWNELVARYGEPRAAAGLPATFAVFGLGKFGGSALGYASDIELLVVYSDQGGTATISNREFFERLVQAATGLIVARREGIFRIDLRLRPWGDDGPFAVHIDSFIAYFSAGGEAHSAERLALIRMRPVAGDPELGRRMMQLRDRIVYESDAIVVREIRELRRLQLDAKAEGRDANAKFSPGALVDLEYNVQLLQVEHGRAHPELRDPGIHATLRGLSGIGAIDQDEAEQMIGAYRFLRTLINGLRMLRGNAQDLTLPASDSPEFLHLARRMGYRDDGAESAATRLRLEFAAQTAAVRGFVERHLGREAIPAAPTGNPADLVYADRLSAEQIETLLRGAGFIHPGRALGNVKRLAAHTETRDRLARLLLLAWDDLSRSPDPDAALNNWERFTDAVTDRGAFFDQLLSQPRRLEIMLRIFAGSQFLADTLVRTPGLLTRVSDPAVVERAAAERDLRAELARRVAECDDRRARLNVVRRFRREEMLRIGTRDICLGGEFGEITAEISALARVVVAATLEVVTASRLDFAAPLALLAFGKLGGNELNYSSDIDILVVYDAPDEERTVVAAAAERIVRDVVRELSDFTEEGQAYRVDVRLRPWGDAGRLAYHRETLTRYYAEEAELWELQTLLKLGPVAGDVPLARSVIDEIAATLRRRLATYGPEEIRATVRDLRRRGQSQYERAGEIDVKNGRGGIRDVEFLVQALQLMHLPDYPGLLTGDTREALERLEEVGLLSRDLVARLRDDYDLLRRVEHILQLAGDQQRHTLPEEQGALARIGAIAAGDRDAARFRERLSHARDRVRKAYRDTVGRSATAAP